MTTENYVRNPVIIAQLPDGRWLVHALRLWDVEWKPNTVLVKDRPFWECEKINAACGLISVEQNPRLVRAVDAPAGSELCKSCIWGATA